jgi:hypothetical protein
MITDDTFTKIVLVAAETLGEVKQKYFNFTDHGGPVWDPLRAALATNVDDGLGFMRREAARTFPEYTWEPRRLIVRVDPFSDLGMVDDLVRAAIRKKALAKLEAHEREALGL